MPLLPLSGKALAEQACVVAERQGSQLFCNPACQGSPLIQTFSTPVKVANHIIDVSHVGAATDYHPGSKSQCNWKLQSEVDAIVCPSVFCVSGATAGAPLMLKQNSALPACHVT